MFDEWASGRVNLILFGFAFGVLLVELGVLLVSRRLLRRSDLAAPSPLASDYRRLLDEAVEAVRPLLRRDFPDADLTAELAPGTHTDPEFPQVEQRRANVVFRLNGREYPRTVELFATRSEPSVRRDLLGFWLEILPDALRADSQRQAV